MTLCKWRRTVDHCRGPLGLLGLLFTSSAVTQPMLGAMECNLDQREILGSWMSALMALGQLQAGRAFVPAKVDASASPAVDYDLPDFSYPMTVVNRLPEVLPQTGERILEQSTEARVNRRTFHQGQGVVHGARGTRYALLDIHWADGGKWIDDVISGQTLGILIRKRKIPYSPARS